MPPPTIRFRPARYLAAFVVIVAVLYGLVFFTGDGRPTPKLGIDLQGGTRVTLTARTETGAAPNPADLDLARQIIEQRVNGLGVSGAEVVRDGDNLVITVPGPEGSQARALGQTARLYLRPVLEGPVPVAPPPPPPGATEATPGGATTPAGPGGGQRQEQAIAQAKELRQSTDPQLQALALQQLDCRAQDPLRGYDDPSLPLVTCNREGTEKYVLGPSPAGLAGTDLASASPQPNPQGVGYVVNLTFESAGPWAEFTSSNIGRGVAVTLDSQVVSAPIVQAAQLDGRSQISGQFNQQSATDLANVLRYGSLPLSFDTSEAQTVSPTLGLASLQAGLIAGAIATVLIFVYSLLYYRALGVLLILSLALSALVIYPVLVLLGRGIGFTLDLAGVAGFIVAIGITADSFIVYFERIKDEMRDGRTFRSAVPRGWARARRTILSGDATSFLAAAVLYVLAAGEVRGFAFTLGMSTVLDLIVVFLVTHPLLALASNSRLFSNPSWSGLGSVTRAEPAPPRSKPAVGAGRRSGR